jgi:excisionase family DNA binding protein
VNDRADLSGRNVRNSGARPEQRLLGIREAANFLGVSPRTLYGWIGQRRIPFRKAGRRVLFLQSELLEWTQPDLGHAQHPGFTKR